MVASMEIVVRGGLMDAAGTCVVCGEDVPAGSGFAARSGDRGFRFKCAECLARFEADPARYVGAGRTPPREADAEESPASEWACY